LGNVGRACARPVSRANTRSMLTVDLQGRRAARRRCGRRRRVRVRHRQESRGGRRERLRRDLAPAMGIFETLIRRGKIDESRKLSSGAPARLRARLPARRGVRHDGRRSRRDPNEQAVRRAGDFTIEGIAKSLVSDFGEKPLDILVHSLANGPEVRKPLLETSRSGYLTAVSVSAYSLVGMVQRLGPLMRPGGRSCRSRTWQASG